MEIAGVIGADLLERLQTIGRKARSDDGQAFRSRFGRAEWLKPYTAGTVKNWPGAASRAGDVAGE
jgi:protoheme ferro-lyase